MDIAVPTRPVRPDDGPRFCRLWSRLSRETVYRRFHAPLVAPPPGALPHLVAVDHDRREALVAVVGDEVVGVARYDRSPADPATAEVAVVVEDGWQGVGVGRQLLGELLDLARRRGVCAVTASVQADNDRVVALVRRLLPAATLRVEAGSYAVSSPLPGAPALAGA
ncbi:GNAT family N-acetyltransferase [Geodermatophilus sabuli]|uniref:GNAT family N-acetyltransferase n=1 Tax=Geodermatophilus sabuli TaxID=1564158 RepID=A0A7K3VUT9_9ACTN|nr:GNAT family N-acetyltransferase [Geodermatophilus sabuli]NEK56419.1 GNAT family N-acetyltransferase [Geodermatophilus sabuli]